MTSNYFPNTALTTGSVQLWCYLHIGGFEQQVAERCVAGRGQHRVFNVSELQTQLSQIIRLGLAACPFRLEEIPERAQQKRGDNLQVCTGKILLKNNNKKTTQYNLVQVSL